MIEAVASSNDPLYFKSLIIFVVKQKAHERISLLLAMTHMTVGKIPQFPQERLGNGYDKMTM